MIDTFKGIAERIVKHFDFGNVEVPEALAVPVFAGGGGAYRPALRAFQSLDLLKPALLLYFTRHSHCELLGVLTITRHSQRKALGIQPILNNYQIIKNFRLIKNLISQFGIQIFTINKEIKS